MNFCNTCLLPDTKPDITFINGKCNACVNYENRKKIDWEKRESELKSILDKYRNESYYDCIIPISGGKDSTYQVIKMLEYGMNPLCVIATTCHLSDIGRKNIENIKNNLDVDVIEFTNNRKYRKLLNKKCLEDVGDISWPEHVSIFTIPVIISVNFNIPLIIWGECSQNEYGGPVLQSENNILNRKWLEEFGGLIGLRVNDIIEMYDIPKNKVLSLQYPEDDKIKKVGVTGLFLGYYIPWDGLTNFLISSAYGFNVKNTIVEGSIVNYENLDNYQTGIHDYFKYLKFGFGRTNDILSLLIRRKLITRKEAINMLNRSVQHKFPKEYLGKPLEEILEYIDLTVDDFKEICKVHTNTSIFEFDKNSVPVLKSKFD
jgi:N-acetyl sugar amidotransferase